MATTFRTRTVRTSQAQLDMPRLRLIRALNSRDAMIWSQLATSYSTSSRGHSPGKVYQAEVRTRNMQPSKRRKLKFHSKNCAVATLQNSESSWSIVECSNSSRNQITSSALGTSKAACKGTISIPRSTTSPGSRID